MKWLRGGTGASNRPGNVRVRKVAPDAAPERPAWGELLIYTDASVYPNPGPAGIGAVLLFGAKRDARREIQEPLSFSTNNEAELVAVLRALQVVKDSPASGKVTIPTTLVTDSRYVIGTVAKGWSNLANSGLVEAVHSELRRFDKVTFIHVRGHRGAHLNERADALARGARLQAAASPVLTREDF